MTQQETAHEDVGVETDMPAESEEPAPPPDEAVSTEDSRGSADDREELLRRAVFAEQALELSRYVKDRELLQRLRSVITGQSEAELTEKLNVLKEVLSHIKEQDHAARPTQEGLEEMVADEVKKNIVRLDAASHEVDAAIGGQRPANSPTGEETASSRLRRLARARGIIIR